MASANGIRETVSKKQGDIEGDISKTEREAEARSKSAAQVGFLSWFHGVAIFSCFRLFCIPFDACLHFSFASAQLIRMEFRPVLEQK